MNGHSAQLLFLPWELELHRQAVTLVGLLPELPALRCHELARAVAIFLNRPTPTLVVVDGKFGLAEHSWLVTNTPGKHIILDVYSVGSVPMVQLHDAGTLATRDARRYREGELRDDVNAAVVETLLRHFERGKTPLSSPL